MLRSIKFTKQIVFNSRIVVSKALSLPQQFGNVLKCDYTTQSDELRRQIDIEVKKGRDSFQLKENLCNAYIEEKNVEKVEELVKNYDFSDFIHHNIIKMHIEMSNTELALNHFNEIRETRPNFKLTRIEAARLARAMFMDEREWSEIIRIFTENKQMPLKGQNVSEIRYFLQKVAEAGNPAEFSELFDVLVATNFVVKDSHMAGFMIKVHLVNNDLPAAVRTFEKQFDERKFTANHVPLMKALITANDMDKLGKVFKLMRTKYSEGDAVLSLVTSFIQVGNISQARALLENNMSRISDHEFRNYCVRYCNYGEYPVLEGLLSATLGLEYDRSKIYSQLLGHFCDENKIDEALELWRRQCGENEEPTIEFLHTLASHLKKNNLSVPFPEPEATPQLSPLAFPEMRKALQKGDPVAALKSWEHINENHSLYTYYASDLVRLLAKNKRYTEAFDISIQTIEAERRVTDVALCDLNQRLAADGHSQLLEQLGEAVPRTTKRSIRFGCELLRAYEKNGKWDEFFNSTLEKRSRNANISERIPMINFLTLLRKQSIPLSQFEKFAEEAADLDAYQPLNVLWAHYFLIGSYKSNELYHRYEQHFPAKFKMAFLGSYLVEMREEEKLEKLLEFAKTNNEKQLAAIEVVTLVTRILNE